jgi:hypothetical protein
VQKSAVREVLSRFGMMQAGYVFEDNMKAGKRKAGRMAVERWEEDEVRLWIGGRGVDVMRTEGVFGKGWRRCLNSAQQLGTNPSLDINTLLTEQGLVRREEPSYKPRWCHGMPHLR